MTTPLACLPRKGCLSVHRPNPCARSVVVIETSYRHAGLFGYFSGRHRGGTVEVEGFGIHFYRFGLRGVKGTASRYLSFALLSHGLLAHLDAILHRFLVVEYQMLLQSGVGNIAPLGGFLHRDITVGLQQPHRFSILFLAPRARAARQAVIQPQPLPCPFAELQHFGIVRA